MNALLERSPLDIAAFWELSGVELMLAFAAADVPRTVYHSRIDGLLLYPPDVGEYEFWPWC